MLNVLQALVKSFLRLISEEIAIIDLLLPRFEKKKKKPVYPRGQAQGKESTFLSALSRTGLFL